MVLEPLLVTAQSPFDLVERLFDARVGLLRASLRLKAPTRTEMQRTIRAIPGSLPRYDDVTADLAVEIARDDRLDLVEHVAAQGFSDVEVLAGNS